MEVAFKLGFLGKEDLAVFYGSFKDVVHVFAKSAIPSVDAILGVEERRTSSPFSIPKTGHCRAGRCKGQTRLASGLQSAVRIQAERDLVNMEEVGD